MKLKIFFFIIFLILLSSCNSKNIDKTDIKIEKIIKKVDNHIFEKNYSKAIKTIEISLYEFENRRVPLNKLVPIKIKLGNIYYLYLKDLNKSYKIFKEIYKKRDIIKKKYNIEILKKLFDLSKMVDQSRKLSYIEELLKYKKENLIYQLEYIDTLIDLKKYRKVREFIDTLSNKNNFEIQMKYLENSINLQNSEKTYTIIENLLKKDLTIKQRDRVLIEKMFILERKLLYKDAYNIAKEIKSDIFKKLKKQKIEFYIDKLNLFNGKK